jgi:hypothetical protein
MVGPPIRARSSSDSHTDSPAGRRRRDNINPVEAGARPDCTRGLDYNLVVRGLRPMGSGEHGSLVCCTAVIAIQSFVLTLKVKTSGSHGSRGKDGRMAVRMRVRLSKPLLMLAISWAMVAGSLLVAPPA